MEIDTREQLPLGRMRRAWDAIRILELWIARVGFVRSRIILYVLYIVVRRVQPLLTLPEPPAHVADDDGPSTLNVGELKTRSASHVRLGLGLGLEV